MLPYFIREILPEVMADQSVVVVGHGNTLRALTYGLEDFDEDAIAGVEFQTGAAIVYTFDSHARAARSAILRC